MDYLPVTLTAYYTVVVTSALLTLIVCFQSIRQPWKRLLLLGLTGQLLWSISKVLAYTSDISSDLLIFFEIIRFAGWLSCLIGLLAKRAPPREWPVNLKALTLFAMTISVGALALLSSSISAQVFSRLLLLLAVLSLIFTEQVIRNLNTQRVLKLLGLCLTLLFTLDLLLYGHSSIAQQIPSTLLLGRAALALVFALIMSIGTLLFSDKSDNRYLFSVSRPAVFYSTAVLFSAVILIVLTFGLVFVPKSNFLSIYIFTLISIAIALLILSLLISKTFKQSFEVFISKHFFTLKYDYRIEWLSAIKQLAALKIDNSHYHSDILKVLQSAVKSESGALWLSNGSKISQVAGKLNLSNTPENILVDEDFIRVMVKESWIFAPNSRTASLAKNNQFLPEWLRNDEDVWLVAPLIIQMKLIGFFILSNPLAGSEITFEDRDLMTNLSTQVANHLLLHQQERVISEAKQLETYNRLSALIMHDMNNITAQLALIGKNAERHKTNPAFVSDMIKTVHNATARMQSLTEKFGPSSEEKRSSFESKDLLIDLQTECNGYSPIPEIIIEQSFTILADRPRLVLALKNLIRNAQEATQNDGKILLISESNNAKQRILIEDTGQGMSQNFIDDDLFRPFISTKEANGIGIGAYLTKSFLEYIGANVTVTSNVGSGTTFEINFS